MNEDGKHERRKVGMARKEEWKERSKGRGSRGEERNRKRMEELSEGDSVRICKERKEEG